MRPRFPLTSRLATLGLLCLGAAPARGTDMAVCFAPGTSDEYVEQVWRRHEAGGFSLAGDDLGDEVRFQLQNRWTATATDGGGLTQGEPTTLTWSYVPDGTSIPGSNGEPAAASNLFAWLNGIYGNFNTWHALFTQVFTRWSELTGITYVYEPNDDGAAFPQSGVTSGASGALGVRGDVRISAHFIDGSPAGGSILAYNFYPDAGDMVIDSADTFFNNTGTNSLRLRNMLAHEHGHGLGLRHTCPTNQTKLMEPFISLAYEGPQHDDILAGQRNYGDPREENDSAGTSFDFGALGAISESNLSLDDAADPDVYAFDVAGPTAVTFTVTPTGSTYLEAPQNANGTCPAGVNFNSLAISNLGIELLGTNGTTVLTSANANPAGMAETINAFNLPGAGTYFARVTGSAANVQLYSLSLTGNNVIFLDGFEAGNTSAWTLTQP